MLILFGSLGCYTAVLIQKSIVLIKSREAFLDDGGDSTPQSWKNSFGLHDLAGRAFGERTGIFVKTLVLVELLMASTAMLILFNDGVSLVLPVPNNH